MSAWRSNLPSTLWDVPRATQDPPDEPHGPCQAYGCPRTGTEADEAILCAFHRGAEAVRAGTRTIGHRAGDSQ